MNLGAEAPTKVVTLDTLGSAISIAVTESARSCVFESFVSGSI